MQKIQDFILGFKSFQQDYFCREGSPFVELNKGQSPSTLVVACCDSRSDPSILMQCEPGDIFVVRTIANIVPPYEPDDSFHGVSAAVEYAVRSLEVSDIIVLGHSSCGGVRALLEEDGKGEFLGKWVSILDSARKEVLTRFETINDDACTAMEMAGILTSMDNLMSFPWLARRVQDKKLSIHGWYFDMQSGRLFGYLPESKKFEPLSPGCPPEES
jgi:carbonic anhydrase